LDTGKGVESFMMVGFSCSQSSCGSPHDASEKPRFKSGVVVQRIDALHDGKDYLLGHYRLHYLTSGRDLLSTPSERAAQPPLLLANPDFGKASASKDAEKNRPHSIYQRLRSFAPLPGTELEAQSLQPLLGVAPRLGLEATEESVRAAQAPLILHIATHGVFFGDKELPAAPDLNSRTGPLLRHDRAVKNVGTLTAEEFNLPGSPFALSQSALILAGAALGPRASGSEHDGLLTAEEARSLDLDGTQLVVLSACQTGQGTLSAGQGVYGLRRAFLVAGAETLISSLWRIDDAATGELMKSYYEKLLAKEHPGDRVGAMQEAMMQMRGQPGRSHPYYWAPFVVVGQDGPLRRLTDQSAQSRH
jgi:CHAT domain-containing protein